ncbi:MAG: hypothetical protein HY592_00290 [Candidatus Omnitrophica bacterium]|nr:hypothetical protein [Candidatus Omnitrophota bacterium]
MVGVICPSRFEYEFLKKSLLKDKRALFVLSGMGKIRAFQGCARLREQNPLLRKLLLIGFAGGLTPNLKIGDLVEPNYFIEQDYNCEPMEKFPNLVKTATPKLLKESARCLMLTQDTFMKDNPYKSGVKKGPHSVIACDMESYAVAYFARQNKARMHAVKLISDAADETADHDFLKACRQLAPRLNEVVSQAIGRLTKN